MTKETLTVLAVPEGGLVASAAAEFKERLREAAALTPGKVGIDMAGSTQIDSVGLGVLIAAHNSLSKQGGRLVLMNVGADIFKLLRSMRLDKHFAVNPEGA